MSGLYRQPAGVVSHVSVLSDKVEDVSSLDAWKRSFIKDGMTDQQKATAIWAGVPRYERKSGRVIPYFRMVPSED